jgi:hypothetical protein
MVGVYPGVARFRPPSVLEVTHARISVQGGGLPRQRSGAGSICSASVFPRFVASGQSVAGAEKSGGMGAEAPHKD